MNILISHPELTRDELCGRITNADSPVRRSTHVGNQPAHELVLQCDMPPGIEILAVDTIQGDDKYSNPRKLRGIAEEPALASSKQAGGRLVGAIAVQTEVEDAPCPPKRGEMLGSFHMRALAALRPANMPVQLSTFLNHHRGVYEPAMHIASGQGELKRCVDENGKVLPLSQGLGQTGLFGIKDSSSKGAGALPSLNTMMAVEMTVTMASGAERTLHLAGPDMVRYTCDEARMAQVCRLAQQTAAELGVRTARHIYEVADITHLAMDVDTKVYASQHSLLLSRLAVSHIR